MAFVYWTAPLSSCLQRCLSETVRMMRMLSPASLNNPASGSAASTSFLDASSTAEWMSSMFSTPLGWSGVVLFIVALVGVQVMIFIFRMIGSWIMLSLGSHKSQENNTSLHSNKKRLPIRPVLRIRFHPEEPKQEKSTSPSLLLLSSSSSSSQRSQQQQLPSSNKALGGAGRSTANRVQRRKAGLRRFFYRPWNRRVRVRQRRGVQQRIHKQQANGNRSTSTSNNGNEQLEYDSEEEEEMLFQDLQDSEEEKDGEEDGDDGDDFEVFDDGRLEEEEEDKTAHDNITNPFHPFLSSPCHSDSNHREKEDVLLPDSFAPLLSSSHMEILSHELTSDLLHALTVKASVKLRSGRHEIPLDKIKNHNNSNSNNTDNRSAPNSSSRSIMSHHHSHSRPHPQLTLDVPSTGVRVSAAVSVGSEGWTSTEDFASSPQHRPTMRERSKPMIKKANVVFDPPVPLINVAPTLVHFPTLFHDHHYHHFFNNSSTPTASLYGRWGWRLLLRVPGVRCFLYYGLRLRSWLETCLWILESHVCPIHLSSIHVAPKLYHHHKKKKQSKSNEDNVNDEWRLQLSFSGHVLLMNFIPIPFLSVMLPTMIIPQPHARVEQLLTHQPLASATLRDSDRINERKLAIALLRMTESWSVQSHVLVTPPAVAVDVTLPGGVAVSVDVGLGRDVQAGRSSSSSSSFFATATPANTQTRTRRSHTAAASSYKKNVQTETSSVFDDDNEEEEEDDDDDDAIAHITMAASVAVSSSKPQPTSIHSTRRKTRENYRRHHHHSTTTKSVNSMSSWSTQEVDDNSEHNSLNRNSRSMNNVKHQSARGLGHSYHRISSITGNERLLSSSSSSPPLLQPQGSNTFDANDRTPWKIECNAKGTVKEEKLSFHILKLSADHEGIENGVKVRSKVGIRGSFAIWKYRFTSSDEIISESEGTPSRLLHGRQNHSLMKKHPHHHRMHSFGSRSKLLTDPLQHSNLLSDESLSVAALLLFSEETESFHPSLRFLQYDYAFDVFESSKLDSITVTIGATHPMLNGGTMITTILDSIRAYGSVAAREDAILNPEERKRKRNILRHLPAIDFTLGVSNVYIPLESYSYSDDGQTLFVPDANGGRMIVRVLGGIDGHDEDMYANSQATSSDTVFEGIKVAVDFEVPSLVLRSEGKVKEFPELEIYEDAKLHSHLSGIISGGVRAHLRPETMLESMSNNGRKVFNPLEAYEIDFSDSSLTMTFKEYSVSLGHRRVIFPAETTIAVKVIESIVDLTFEGKTQCELSWDFQGSSPILQVTRPGGKSPASASPEDKRQISLLVAPLRQGRLSLNVSSVGGVHITKAVTSREDREGLYDWKFFNAIISPDQNSAGRLLDVLHDKRTMEKLLQIIHLVNKDLHNVLRYGIRQLWRAKELFDQEGITDPGHIIPMYKMARLMSLFVTGDTNQVDRILPIIRRVVHGDGLDIVEVKELLRQNLENYEEWAPELDRVVRWVAVCFGPMNGIQPFVEENVTPLSQLPHYELMFRGIPSAAQLYAPLLEKRQLPLDPSFSNLVSRVASYLSFKQVEFFLETRDPHDWQPADLKRIRYVYSIKRKVLEIAESYGGLPFLPQSFLVSVFLGEATRTRLRASKNNEVQHQRRQWTPSLSSKASSRTKGGLYSTKASRLRQRRGSNRVTPLKQVSEFSLLDEDRVGLLSPERIASLREFKIGFKADPPQHFILDIEKESSVPDVEYELGDSLLGPQDVAILLQAGLTSAMKSSTVVQLNQRMLLDLICSQPRSFAIAVLAEIGSPSGQGSVRGLTSALMALLELDQSSFKSSHQIDMVDLLESWLPGVRIPKREDYLAGGRWARQSYYEALYSLARSILEDAESYSALKLHLQRVRTTRESDPIPQPKEYLQDDVGLNMSGSSFSDELGFSPKLMVSVSNARELIDKADQYGKRAMEALFSDSSANMDIPECRTAIQMYEDSFQACAKVIALDKHAFHAPWFRNFYRRNYDALMILNILDNVIENVDKVRYWLHRLLKAAKKSRVQKVSNLQEKVMSSSSIKELSEVSTSIEGGAISADNDDVVNPFFLYEHREVEYDDDVFLKPEQQSSKQVLIDAIIDSLLYEAADRERLRRDPLVRLLIRNAPGHYNFTIVSAMGVVTEGERGIELIDAFKRLEQWRGVQTIRSDTATARSFEYNAAKIEDAIQTAVQLGRPYGYLGYSQGCANALLTETTMLSGTPKQQQSLLSSSLLVNSRNNAAAVSSSSNSSAPAALVCRQLLFSAANGSVHGVAMEKKIQRLIVMCEEFFKYQQGYVSRALSSWVLEWLNGILDSAYFHKLMGGAQSFLPEGCRFFWREAQHCAHVPTCTLRGVLDDEDNHSDHDATTTPTTTTTTTTTPECLEMVCNMLTQQSGSALHDSQVHVFDAVGHPVYHHNRNANVLKAVDVGNGAIQRTHHWSPLCDEVQFVQTAKDVENAIFDCAKDRHVFPWVDVNVRLGFIHYVKQHEPGGGSDTHHNHTHSDSNVFEREHFPSSSPFFSSPTPHHPISTMTANAVLQSSSLSTRTRMIPTTIETSSASASKSASTSAASFSPPPLLGSYLLNHRSPPPQSFQQRRVHHHPHPHSHFN